MQKVIIKAHNGRGESKVLAGEVRDVNKPDTIEEAVEEYGAEDVLAGFWASHVIYVQNMVRTGGGTSDRAKTNALVSIARKQKADGDSSLYDKLVAVEIIKE